MAGIRASIEIDRSVEAVFGYFLDLERNIPAADPKVASVVKVTDGPVGPGTTYLIRQPALGRMRQQTMRVVAVDPNRTIEMDAAFGPVRPRFSVAFEPTAAGTRITVRGDSRPVGIFKLVGFVMDRIGQRNWDRRLRLIKDVLEAGATRDGAAGAGMR
jgi:hypothetical protein